MSGRPRNDYRKPANSDIKTKPDPVPNAWSIPLQQSDVFRGNAANGKPVQHETSRNNRKHAQDTADKKYTERSAKSDTAKTDKSTRKPIDVQGVNTSNLNDALKTMLRIDSVPVPVSSGSSKTALQQNTPAPLSAETDKPQTFDLMAILQKASNGVPSYEQFPRPEALPQPPATWHQKAKEAKKQEIETVGNHQQLQLPQEQEQQQEQLNPQVEQQLNQETQQLPQQQLPPIPQTFMWPGQPRVPLFPPSCVPMPLAPINYGFPPNFYPLAMMPPPMPMMTGPFHGQPVLAPNIQQFAQYHAPPHVAMFANPIPNINSDNVKSSAPVNAFIPLQAARKIAKDKASTKAAVNSNDTLIEPTQVGQLLYLFVVQL